MKKYLQEILTQLEVFTSNWRSHLWFEVSLLIFWSVLPQISGVYLQSEVSHLHLKESYLWLEVSASKQGLFPPFGGAYPWLEV